MKKTFELAHLLSVSTGRIMPVDSNEDYPMRTVYQLLNFMSGETLPTHALPRVSGEAGPYLREQFPWLAEIDDSNVNSGNVREWYAAQVAKYGKYHEVRPMHVEDHEVLDPIEDLLRINPNIKPIIITDEPIEPPVSPFGDID